MLSFLVIVFEGQQKNTKGLSLVAKISGLLKPGLKVPAQGEGSVLRS